MSDVRVSPPKRRSGLKTLLIVVALCGMMFFVASQVRDAMRPALGKIRALRSTKVEDRRAAAEGLVGLNLDDAKLAIPTLKDALGDPDHKTNIAILLALGEAGLTVARDPAGRSEARDAIRAVVGAITDPQESVRFESRRILKLFTFVPVGDAGPLYDPAPVARTLARLVIGDPSPMARSDAALTLILVARESPADPPAELAAALTATDLPGDVRGVAASLLGAFPKGHPKAFPSLVEALKDRDPKVRRGAAMGLAMLGPATAKPALPALIAMLSEPSGDPIPAPTPTMLISQATRPPFLSVLSLKATPDDPTPYSTWDPALSAAQAVGAMVSGLESPEGAIEALVAMLSADQAWRREASASILNRLGRKAATAAPAMVEALLRVIPDAQSRLAPDLIQAIAKASPHTPDAEGAVDALTKALSGASDSTIYAAANALVYFGPTASPALPMLRTLSQGPKGRIAAKAAETIAKIPRN